MTISQKFQCRACGRSQGPFSTHGYDSTTGNGHQIMLCRACRKIGVYRLVDHVVTSPCTCGGDPEVFKGGCPECSSLDSEWMLVLP